jgi:hypothetical protein
MWFLLSVINSESQMKAIYAECRYSECCYAECRGATNVLRKCEYDFTAS